MKFIAEAHEVIFDPMREDQQLAQSVCHLYTTLVRRGYFKTERG